jgi:Protein of unknown function (DUF3179)
MEDRETGSVWTHFDGKVLTGPLANKGIELETVPLVHTRWNDWLADYPNSQVLLPDERFTDRYFRIEPGNDWLGPDFVKTIIATDDRLVGNELVLGIDTGDTTTAIVIQEFENREAINLEVGGLPLVALIDPESLLGIAFESTVDGEVREFELSDGVLVDNTGARWATDGSGDDGQLQFVTSFVTEWYGWSGYHPGTAIYDN